MKKLFSILTAAVILMLLFTGCNNSDNLLTPETIRERGYLLVGVKEDVPYFSFFDTESGDFSGLEIELAEMISESIFGNRESVQFIPVTTRTRAVALEHGDIDIAIATFTPNSERLKEFCFTSGYYTDNAGLLVRDDSPYRDLGDLYGKTVGVLQGSTSAAAVSVEAKHRGIDLTTVTYASYEDIQAALIARRVDAFCTDRAILRGYMTPELRLTPDQFSPQQYAVAAKKENTELIAYIDDLIMAWTENGTLDALKAKYGV
jgi:putative glutamine transport system substrate-binding protein